MEYYNHAEIAGEVVRDISLRYTSGNNAFANFTVAVKRVYNSNDGSLKQGTDYIDVVVWDPDLAKECASVLKNGSFVRVEGSLRTSIYNSKDGSGKKFAVEISAEKVVFLDLA